MRTHAKFVLAFEHIFRLNSPEGHRQAKLSNVIKAGTKYSAKERIDTHKRAGISQQPLPAGMERTCDDLQELFLPQERKGEGPLSTPVSACVSRIRSLPSSGGFNILKRLA